MSRWQHTNPHPSSYCKVRVGQIWRHVKRGTQYEVLAFAVGQGPGIDYEDCVLYVDAHLDQAIPWVRKLSEFTDGRFEQVLISEEEPSDEALIASLKRNRDNDALIDSLMAYTENSLEGLHEQINSQIEELRTQLEDLIAELNSSKGGGFALFHLAVFFPDDALGWQDFDQTDFLIPQLGSDALCALDVVGRGRPLSDLIQS